MITAWLIYLVLLFVQCPLKIFLQPLFWKTLPLFTFLIYAKDCPPARARQSFYYLFPVTFISERLIYHNIIEVFNNGLFFICSPVKVIIN